MKLFKILALTAIPFLSMDQSTIFTENCGNPASTTVVSSFTGWQNYGVLSYTGTADVRTTLPSSVYVGASGQGNTFITNAENIISANGYALRVKFLTELTGSNPVLTTKIKT
jgi:hypothetical protein